jgi:hypothetical protein
MMNNDKRDRIHVATNEARRAIGHARYWVSHEPTMDQLDWVVQLLHEIDTFATIAADDYEVSSAANRLCNFIEQGP